MDFKEMKQIKDLKNDLEIIKKDININLEKINDSVIYNNFYFILDDIRNNVAIDKYSMSSIFDYSEPTYKECKEYIDNNMAFIMELKNNNILKYIGNDYKDIFKNLNITLNLYIVEKCYFEYENIDLNDYDIEIKDINNHLDYLNYLDRIKYFYESLNDIMKEFINTYGEYILK